MSARGEWTISYWHYTPGPSSPIQMMRGAMKCMECGGVKPGDMVLVSTDTNKVRIAEALAGAAYAVGATPIILMIPPVKTHGAQLPEPVVAAFREADVFLQPSTWSQTHTKARVEAIKAGKRGSTMCEITEDALCVGAIEADYEACDRMGRKLGAVLADSKEVRITSPLGTDIRGEVKGRPVQYETGLFKKPGQFVAFPDSEINISPVEGTAEGTARRVLERAGHGGPRPEVWHGVTVRPSGEPGVLEIVPSTGPAAVIAWPEGSDPGGPSPSSASPLRMVPPGREARSRSRRAERVPIG